MPKPIRILSPQVAAQIAAGEVILRPAAVVKELVENSLDAAARAVTVEIEEGGRRFLRVADDGWGMSPAEAELSLKRHATSKLRDEADLLNIHTLGFRGEALPSIAAVSRLTLLTCPPGGAGHRLVVVAGELKESSPWAAAPGTSVSAAELFFNTPARRKFLKSKDAEQAQILETMRHLALGYPSVHFTLKTPARVLLSAPPTSDLAARVAALFGPEMAARLLPVAFSAGSWQVTGLLSDPEFSLASSRFQVFLVNRRVVQDRVLGAVLKATFAGLLPRGRHPAAVLHLTLPAADVDVNVHPAKAEVRFQDPGRVYSFLLAALRQALGPLSGAGTPSYTVTLQPDPPRAAEASWLSPVPSTAPSTWEAPPSWPQTAPAPVPTAAPPLAPRSWRFQDLAVIGQLKNTYILAQAPEGLVLIDQHAAHERVLYESLKAGETAAARQALLFPRVVEVPIVQADWVRENLEVLAQTGLELSHFGGASFLITAAPAFLAACDLEAVVTEAIEILSPLKSGASPQTVHEQARQFMACRGAIKAGEFLKEEAILALLVQLDEIPVSSHCPHGRPLWRLIPFSEIHQSFRRPK
ncbi:MAG: DNA mismatch repair endonuclease MutL [Deltaproteobacteria bacterium]|nr:DNA mismatch repair endonuclease MutL [Deltaproteobacteria bacterium]